MTRLTIDDLDQVATLLRAAHDETRYRTRPFNEARATKVLQAVLHSPALFARGIHHDEQLVGLMIGEIADSLWWSSERIATSLALYVLPEHRGRGAELVRAFLEWAKASGANHVTIGVTAGIDDERAGALLESFGLVRQAAAFEMEI